MESSSSVSPSRFLWREGQTYCSRVGQTYCSGGGQIYFSGGGDKHSVVEGGQTYYSGGNKHSVLKRVDENNLVGGDKYALWVGDKHILMGGQTDTYKEVMGGPLHNGGEDPKASQPQDLAP